MPQRFNLRVDSCEYAANEGLNEKTKLLSKNMFPIVSRQSRGRSMEQLTRLFYPHLFVSVFLRKEIEKSQSLFVVVDCFSWSIIHTNSTI